MVSSFKSFTVHAILAPQFQCGFEFAGKSKTKRENFFSYHVGGLNGGFPYLMPSK